MFHNARDLFNLSLIFQLSVRTHVCSDVIKPMNDNKEHYSRIYISESILCFIIDYTAYQIVKICNAPKECYHQFTYKPFSIYWTKSPSNGNDIFIVELYANWLML